MKMRIAAIAALTLTAGLVLSGCAGDAPAPADSPRQSASPSVSADASEANDADKMFAAMMIPHHEQAIEMSDVLLAKDGVDEKVATLAQEIKAAQGPEIEQLQGWLDAWGVDPSHGDMGHGGHGDGMMTDDDMAALEAVPGEEASRLFLEQMIVHHEGAVEMAETEVKQGADADAVALAQRIIDAQTAEIQLMRELLGQPRDTVDEATGAILAAHGLDGLDARGIIAKLDTMPLAERPTDLMASIRPTGLVLADDTQREATVPMPEGELYVSFAPYVSQTHDCWFHSLTTCTGELRGADVKVTVTDATGATILDETSTTYDNGFLGVWLPRDIDGTLTVEHDGKVATSPISTKGDEAATCVTTLPLA